MLFFQMYLLLNFSDFIIHSDKDIKKMFAPHQKLHHFLYTNNNIVGDRCDYYKNKILFCKISPYLAFHIKSFQVPTLIKNSSQTMESNERLLNEEQSAENGHNMPKIQKMSSIFGSPKDHQQNDNEEEDMLMDLDEEGELGPRFLIEQNPKALQRYRIYLEERLIAGQCETMVELGAPIDCSYKERGLSLDELQKCEELHNKLLASIDCTALSLINRMEKDQHTKVLLVRRNIDETDFIEVRIAVVGNVDAGKSTLLGVLTHNILDDGRGNARRKLFRYKHEFESGRTSSVGNDILGFSMSGEVTNKPNTHSGHLDWMDICKESAKVITFIDLAGHEKYLKTTIFGMTGHMPDYTMLMIGSNAGIIGTTKEHLSLALSLQVPVLVVVTKIDMCPPNILAETMNNLDRLLKSPGSRKRPILIKEVADIVQAAENFHSGKVCPIFQVSNVLGTNLDLLRKFLNIIPIARTNFDDRPAEFQIDDIYWVDGVGTVVSGTCLAGRIVLNDNLLLGPDGNGTFTMVPIKSIHRKRMPVQSIKSGQTASFALRKVNRKEVRKGMMMLSAKLNPMACFEFEAEVLILHHPTTIAPNYQAMVHVGSIRQTATILKMNKEVLRTGDRDTILLCFIRHPEYVRIGTRMVFREGRTKAVGTIRKIFPYAQPVPKKSTRLDKKQQNQAKYGISKQQSRQKGIDALGPKQSAKLITKNKAQSKQQMSGVEPPST